MKQPIDIDYIQLVDAVVEFNYVLDFLCTGSVHL